MAPKKKEKQRWIHNVKTVSTFPPAGLFAKDARTIAKAMASKKVSPKGLGSGIRMIQFFMNRAGKSLPQARKRALEQAKKILQARLHKGENSRKIVDESTKHRGMKGKSAVPGEKRGGKRAEQDHGRSAPGGPPSGRHGTNRRHAAGKLHRAPR